VPGIPARKGVELRGHLSRRLFKRVGLLAAVAILAAFGVSSLASATGSGKAGKKADVRRVLIKGTHNPHFVPPATVHHGDVLKIINETNPNKIGPHTFSLVKNRLIPRTRSEERHCFDKGNICRHVAHWHGGSVKGGPQKKVVRAGKPGWNREGDYDRRGDSFFMGSRLASFKQKVTAKAGRTLHFMCIVHPFMHDRIVVKP
jgi:hypothetical protein